MFYPKNPADLGAPWVLSSKDDAVIPLEIAKSLKNYHLMGIEFLYHNYRRGFKGSILNESESMNSSLQISVFLSIVIGMNPQSVLIICSPSMLPYWRYHLINHGQFEVIRLTAQNLKDSMDKNSKTAFLLDENDLKLCENLSDNIFSIVIDNIDRLATKLVIKRLKSSFNIGITSRNFYLDPDQKLMWNMLNWTNPGCVGKLNNFYEIDNRNRANFRNNYRFWWLRLTWNFCESFQHPSPEEMQCYEQEIASWNAQNPMEDAPEEIKRKPVRRKTARNTESERKTRPSKNISKRSKQASKMQDDISVIKIEAGTSAKRKSRDDGSDLEDPSQKVSKYEPSINKDQEILPLDKYVQLPSMDEIPIVDSIKSIMTNFTLPVPKRKIEPAPSTSHYSESQEFVFNLIRETQTIKDYSDEAIENILKEADAALQD